MNCINECQRKCFVICEKGHISTKHEHWIGPTKPNRKQIKITTAEQIEDFCNIQSFDLHSKLMLYGSSRARIFKTCTLGNSLLLYPCIIPGGAGGGGGEAREL